MKIIAWHSSHDFRSKVHREQSPSIALDETHFKLPVELTLDHTVPNEEALESAFHFFNWVPFGFAPPEEVNTFCAEKGTHDSMSVGDVVQLPDGSYWSCAPVGWERITDITRNITEGVHDGM